MIKDSGNPGDDSRDETSDDPGYGAGGKPAGSGEHPENTPSPGAAGGERQDGADADQSLLLSLQDAQAKADEYWNELLRTRAELSNLQRRAERDVSNAHKYGIERFAGELLPVLDSLELGLNAASGSGSSEAGKLREGMELTLKMLMTALEKFGITPIEPDGEKFNPDFHQAMAMQPVDGVEPNTIVTVYQKGWRLHDRLLRPAMVVVAGNASAGGDNVGSQEAGGTPDGGRKGGGNIDETA